ncbi:MAG: TIGR01777 family oxidoreductase [Polaribacter sp.]
MTKILITGGTGLIGRHLTEKLIEKNYEVVILTRNPKNKNEFKWDIDTGYIDENVFKNIDYGIHLAGAGIADKRWTDKRKEEIIHSRVASTNLLFEKTKEHKVNLKGFISASAIGFYGAKTTDTIFTETDKPADDFLGKVCQLWEEAIHQFKKENIRIVILRTGIVLTKKGGALAKMKTPIISPIGSGKQYMPWIHIDDLCTLYIASIENNLSGIYNAVAPEHQINTSFSKTLAKKIKRLYVPIGVPSFLLKLIFGEMANLLLKGSRVSSKKIEKSDFNFEFRTLTKALENLV